MARSVKQIAQKLESLTRKSPLVHSTWWAKLNLLKTLVQRDLDARYQGSILGNLWPLVNQLVQLLVYTYVFSVVLQVKLSLKGLPANNFTFGLWLFAGLLPWISFTSGLSQAATSVISQPNLVKKVVFPLALLPLVPVFSTFIESLMGLMLLLTFLVFTSKTLHSTLLLLPLIWIPQLLLTAGLGYFAAGLTVFLRDIPQTIGILLNLWFYLTPIIYPITAIPEPLRLWVWRINPLTTIIEVYRDLILVGQVQHLVEWVVIWLVCLLVFTIGWWVYRRLRPAFADVL